MRIGVIGAGRIGANVARRLALAGHDVTVSFSRDPKGLATTAREIGAAPGSPAEAAAAEVVVLSVPWAAIPEALEQAGPLDGRMVIDTTNQFGPGPKPAEGQTAAAFNAARMPGARYTKSFNTLTAQFQVEAAEREGAERVVQWVCADDAEGKALVMRLIEQAGYVPIDLAGTEGCEVMEAPRRDGAVYGEEYREPEALAVVDAVGAARPIPPTPDYA